MKFIINNRSFGLQSHGGVLEEAPMCERCCKKVDYLLYVAGGCSMKSISIQSLKEQLDTIHLIDIRETIEFSTLPKLKQAKHIPMNQLIQQPEAYLNKKDSYYLICRSGARTERVTGYLERLGYDVINVVGGMLEFYQH